MKSGTALLNFCLFVGINFNLLSANELTPPKQYERVSPDFLNIPLESSYSLPPVKSVTDTQKEDKTEIHIKKVQIKGNTSLSRDQIKPVIKRILNKTVSMEKLERVRYDISKLYYESGYINSGVIFPKQSYEDGLVLFLAIEGSLSEVNISGLSTLNPEQLRTRLINGAGTPLNINALQATLDQINTSSNVDRLHASLLAGSAPGKSILNIEIVELDRYNVIFGIDNYRSPSIGAERGFVAYQYQNLTGYSDSISLQAGLTRGVKDYSFKYEVPLPQYKSRLIGYYVKSDSQFIEDELASLDINNSASIYGAKWNYEFGNKNKLHHELGIGVELLKNRNSIIGIDEESVLMVTNQLQLKAIFNHLIDTSIRLGKTTSELSQTEGDFSLLKIKTQSQKKADKANSTIQIKSTSQFNTDSLLGLEKMSIGGFHTVRGYRENTLVKDNGVVLNIEYNIKLSDPFLTATAFTDVATGWNHKESDSSEQLFSLGAGLNWNNHKNINIDSFIGLPLMNKPDKSGNLQDFGLHFGIQYKL